MGDVSKAAERSRRKRMVKRSSAAFRRSLVILMRSVLLLWMDLKRDWRSLNSLWWDTWCWSWAATALSKILLRKGRLEIGW